MRLFMNRMKGKQHSLKINFCKLCLLTIFIISFLVKPGLTASGNSGMNGLSEPLSVLDFLPQHYVRDGSVNYRKQLQSAIDTALARQCNLLFPPMIYRIDETGLRVDSHLTLLMYGAVFQLDGDRKKDGQVFYGKDVSGM